MVTFSLILVRRHYVKLVSEALYYLNGLSWTFAFSALNAEAIGRIPGFKGGDFSQAVQPHFSVPLILAFSNKVSGTGGLMPNA